MQQHDSTTSVSLPSAHEKERPLLLELRGPSGKCYGEFDPSTGVLIFRRGKLPAERIDLTPYFRAVAKGEK